MTEREQFEAWGGDQGYPLRRIHDEADQQYLDLRTQGAWESWQAARAQSSTPNPVEVGTTVQAGQMLTLDEVRESVHEAGLDWHNGWTVGEDAENRYLNLCRAIEQAVLAKRVPMTEAQIEHALRSEPMVDSEESFVRGIRAAEKFHGIAGKEGE